MDKRSKRVSASQWDIALDFFERNPNVVRGYSNSSRARELTQRLWRELAELLNAEGSGATKTHKEWATYFNNFKSKLKKMVSDLNTEATSTGGGPPQAETLSDIDKRFLSVMGSGFGQGAPNVRVNPFPSVRAALEEPAPEIEVLEDVEIEDIQINEIPAEVTGNSSQQEPGSVNVRDSPPASHDPVHAGPDAPLPRRTRRTRRYHTRPMAPIDEARRILSQVELQRAAADAEQARALHLIGQNLGRLADIAERLLITHQNMPQ